MPTRSFRLATKRDPERVTKNVRRAFFRYQYHERPSGDGRILLVREVRFGVNPTERPHRVFIAIRTAGEVTNIKIEAVLGFPASEKDLDELEHYLRALLQPALRSPPELFQGRVSDDGSRVEIEGEAPKLTLGPERNDLIHFSRASLRIFLVSGVVLGFLLLLFTWVVLTGQATLRETAFPFVVLSFFLVLPVVVTAYYLFSFHFPSQVNPQLKGLQLEFRIRSARWIPWGVVQTFSKAPDAIGDWRLYYGAPGRQVRWVQLGPQAAAQVYESRTIANQLGGTTDSRAADSLEREAFLMTTAGTHVVVTESKLGQGEMSLLGLHRRFLPSGPLSLPLYVTDDEDRKLVLDCVHRRSPPAEGLRKLAREAHRRGHREIAVELFRNLLTVAKDDDAVLDQLVDAMLELKMVQEARQAVMAYEAQFPARPGTWIARAKVCLAAGEHADGLAAIGRAVELDPNNPAPFAYWIGAVEDTAQAIQEVEYFAQLHPQAWAPLCALAEFFLESDRPDQAIRYSEAAILRQENDLTLSTHAYSLMGKSDNEAAVQIIEQARTRSPLGPQSLIALAWAYSKLGAADQADAILNGIGPEMGEQWVRWAELVRRNIRAEVLEALELEENG